MPPKIYFAPCGMGLGHSVRALSVLRAILRYSNVEAVFSSYGVGADFLETTGVKCIRVPPVEYGYDHRGYVNVRSTLEKGWLNLFRFFLQIGHELNILGRELPSIVVSDGRITPIVASFYWGIPSVLITNQLRVYIPVLKPNVVKLGLRDFTEEAFTYTLSLGWRLATEVLIPDFPPPYCISLQNLVDTGVPRSKMRFIGPILPVWPNDAGDDGGLLPRRSKGIILASFTGLRGEREALLSFLMGCMREALRVLDDEYTFVVSRGKHGGRHVEVLYGGRVLVVDWLENKHALLKKASLIITHGGHTSVLEAIVYGVPALHLVNAGHTERLLNARAAEKLGVARTIVIGRDGASEFISALRDMLSEDVRQKARSLANRLSKYRGDEEAARRVLAILERYS